MSICQHPYNPEALPAFSACEMKDCAIDSFVVWHYLPLDWRHMDSAHQAYQCLSSAKAVEGVSSFIAAPGVLLCLRCYASEYYESRKLSLNLHNDLNWTNLVSQVKDQWYDGRRNRHGVQGKCCIISPLSMTRRWLRTWIHHLEDSYTTDRLIATLCLSYLKRLNEDRLIWESYRFWRNRHGWDLCGRRRRSW